MESASQEQEVGIKAMFQEFTKGFKHPELAKFLDDIEDPIAGESLEAMLARIQKLRNKLVEKVDEIYATSNLSKERVNRYMENPDNFTRREWETIENFKIRAEEYVKEFQIASQGAGIREIVREGRKRAQKKKTKLERQSNSDKKWIPMS